MLFWKAVFGLWKILEFYYPNFITRNLYNPTSLTYTRSEPVTCHVHFVLDYSFCQSSQLAELLWTDLHYPSMKSGISVRELISTLKKRKRKHRWGMNGRTFSQNHH